MRIDTFKIEEWMNMYCPNAVYDLTSTCIQPLSIRELMNISGIQRPLEIFDTKLTYGDIRGSIRLRHAIKCLYSNQEISNITVTHGAIGANQLVFEALLEKSDEVVCLLPAYQQHYSLPKSIGADVKHVFLREENNWQPNFTDIEKVISSKTKLLCLTNPNNPTGSVISDEDLIKLANLAKAYNIWVLSDEVYRGLNLVGNPYSVSFADIYDKGISVGSLSKTYSLPGLRVGWVCAREDLINEINKHREYNTISISIVDDYYSAIAIENRDKIALRNFRIMREGFEVLKNRINENIYLKANLPQGGTTVLIRYRKDIPSRSLCKELQSRTGVAILPGETLEMEGTVRIGYCVGKEVLDKGMAEFSKFIKLF